MNNELNDKLQDYEVIYKLPDSDNVDDCFYDYAIEALSDIAQHLRDGYKIIFMSMITRVSVDLESGDVNIDG